MLRESSTLTRRRSRSSRIVRPAEHICRGGARERRAVSQDAGFAEEGEGPVRGVGVGPVGDGDEAECAGDFGG